jgi:hypothetical protein
MPTITIDPTLTPRGPVQHLSGGKTPVLTKCEHTTNLLSQGGGYGNGFFSAVLAAYNEHVPLELRADDILAMIHIAVSNFVNAHAEELRERFVNHKGKEKIEVQINSLTDLLISNAIFTSFTAQMDQRLVGPLQPSFTTTTPFIASVQAAMTVATMKHYYECRMMLACGIAKVTLLGTLADWQDLIARADALHALFAGTDLAPWFPHLKQLLGFFLQTASLPDGSEAPAELKSFWQRIVTAIPKGSGGEKDYAGWIGILMPVGRAGNVAGVYKASEGRTLNVLSDVPMPDFRNDEEKKRQWKSHRVADLEEQWLEVSLSTIPPGTLEGPITLVYPDGSEKKFTLTSGFMGPRCDPMTGTVSTNFGWKLTEGEEADDEEDIV